MSSAPISYRRTDETYQLLNISDDDSDDDEIPDLNLSVPTNNTTSSILGPGGSGRQRTKVRRKRKHRPQRHNGSTSSFLNSGVSSDGGGSDSEYYCRGHGCLQDCTSSSRNFLCYGAVLVLIVSIGTLAYFTITTNAKLFSMTLQLQKVLEEKQHMSDNNHFFRTRIEELSNNQTELKLNMSIVQKQITSLSSQLLSLNSSLSLVVSNWASVPQLETLPSEVEAVKRNVASFGSSLTDLQTQVAEIGSTVGNQTRDIKSIRQTLSSPQSTGAPPALVDSATVARQIELSNRTDILKDNVVELSRSVQEIKNIIGEKFKKQEEQDDQDLKLINRLKDDVQNVSARAETNRNECQALKLSVDELDQRVGGLEKKVEGKEDDKKVEKRSTREKSFDEEKEMSFTAEETDEDDEYYRR